MVQAIRRGLPESYTTIIANIGCDIPQTYPEWKAQVLIMYNKWQKKFAFDQSIGAVRDNRSPPKGPSTTATSFQKTGGTTSSLSAKPTSSAAPSGGRDTGGRWITRPGTMFGGAGAPMDISKLHSEGRCFRCHKKGHMGKDCLQKREFRDIQSVQVTNEPVMGSKVKEVKEVKEAAV
ncbi:uncharacterized protein ARMOST_19755 [Armillaria ostoyae]|uniref:CCHC-type domain-containing protein n=1 Tax=Armillaria ostoyae TaxID=47428 RepID=A0A284S5E2_ARMOS|nr:uncharacterized protein ARMOST_19755 [Armillaria ostoyae]